MKNKKKNKKLEAMAAELAKDLKTEDDLSSLMSDMLKVTIEHALKAEMDTHLGYEKNASNGRNSGNSRNGYSSKTIRCDNNQITIDTPRDRNGDFEPQLVKKGQSRLAGLDKKILTLYAKGMTTRDIADTFQEMYSVDVSHTLISNVTDSVMEEVIAWQNRPLNSIYPVVYFDCIVVKVHHEKRVIKKAIYLALGINEDGMKELLGIWMSQNEGAKFWMSVMTELETRGVKDIFIACIDGLTGFPESITNVFPKTQIQLCIVHMVRNSLKYVSYKHRKSVARDLKKIYKSITAEEAYMELKAFADTWDDSYAAISRMWERNWENIIPLFNYPDAIRKIIYTTNAIESLNSVIRKAIKNRKIFPSDKSAMKVVYLAIQQASKKWTMPLRDWMPAMNRFLIEYEARF